ncbi:MAG TPA: rhodanese-like domain-containing protein, partial [Trueperaceae bacterium]|nr:rhodanese-like domain-containing protein [Trueperaceae bacterium]
RLIRVGIDNVIGFVSDISELDRFKVETIKPQELNNTDDYFVLDVRTANDYNEGHLDNATQIHGSRIMWNLDKLPRDKKILSYCQKGLTNTIASSALRSAGFNDIVELEGGYSAWLDAKRQPALAN